MAHDHGDSHHGPQISCGCGCHDHESQKRGPLDNLVEQAAQGVEHLLPGRAGQWFCHLEDEARRDLLFIVLAAILLLAAVLTRSAQVPLAVQVILFALAYCAVGADILAASYRGIRAGDVFNENFLMSIASLGAFALGEFPEAVAVMLFYRIGEFFEDRAVDSSRDQIMSAVDMRPETVNMLASYEPQRECSHAATAVPAEQACIGDYVLIRPGERIPLDAVVVEGASRIDTSPVTGEPVPVAVVPGDELTSGCLNESGVLVAQVQRPLSESMVTRILDSVEHAASNKPQLERFITRFARVYTPIVIAIAAITALVPSLITGDWSRWLYTACTFLVISCPCAIVLSVPLSFFAGIGAASRQGILFKGGSSIEALKRVRAVAMDKTGTVTQGNFKVVDVQPRGGFSAQDVLACAAAAEQASTHPIACSIVQAARAQDLATADAAEVCEVAGKGVQALLSDGRSEALAVLCGSAGMLQEQGVQLPSCLPPVQGTQVFVAVEGVLAGVIYIDDAIKPDSAQAVIRLSTAGLHTALLTGDGQESAQAVAEQVGIKDVQASLLPDGKLSCLQDIRRTHGPVMFVGDGINDAPVLAGADVGAAMGSGSDAAIQAADVVFMASSLLAVPQSLDIARKVHAVALQNIIFALVVKLMIMALGFAGFASMWAAVFADVGVALLCILNAVRLLYIRY